MEITFRKISHALGAEVCGIDITQPISETEFGSIYRAFLENGILLLRGQNCTREQHIEFSRRFGDLDNHDALPRDRARDAHEILLVTNAPNADGSPGEGRYTGRQWHSDMSFTSHPSLGSLLRAVKIPDVGGDTQFANMYAAYDTLPDALKQAIEGKTCIHDSSRNSAGELRQGFQRTTDVTRTPGAVHPLVRLHPLSNRKALFLGRRPGAYIHGLSVEESEKILDAVWMHATQEQFTWYQKWRIGDLVMWDNRCVMHRRDAFDESLRRLMHRTQIVGEPVLAG